MKKIFFFLIIVAASSLFTSAAMGESGQAPGSAPKDREWIRNLDRALALERLACDQYKADIEKSKITMPYRAVVPNKEEHIQAILDLYRAYGLAEEEQPKTVVKTKTTAQAYRLGIKMEQDLITLYEGLVRDAGDRDSSAVLNKMLIRTRKHLVLFEHALRVDRGMGKEVGPGGQIRP